MSEKCWTSRSQGQLNQTGHFVAPTSVLTHFENIKVESKGSINEVQSTCCDCDGELVIENLAVQFFLE